MNSYTKKDHTFVVCAYGESGFLPECLDSLLAQKPGSNIIISTATPNEYIKKISDTYGTALHVNPQPPGIAGDWSFAHSAAGTRLVTLAHQDDIYLPDYLSTALDMLNKSSMPIIFFSHYADIRNGEVEYKSLRLNVKKFMLKPLKIFRKSRFIRRRILSFGNPICCPSVMYVDIGHLEFSGEFKFVLDWAKWEELSKRKGSFVYCEKPLMYHRIHPDAETTKAIRDSTRRQEDYIIFRKFWCTPIAKVLTKLYTKSEDGVI